MLINTLSENEAEKDWKLLFDGQNFEVDSIMSSLRLVYFSIKSQ